MIQRRRRLVVSSRMISTDPKTTIRRTDVFAPDSERKIIVERAYDGTPVVSVSAKDLREVDLDSRAAFLLTLIDGATPIDSLLDICAMPRDLALAVIEDLVERGIVVLQARRSIPPRRESIAPRRGRRR